MDRFEITFEQFLAMLSFTNIIQLLYKLINIDSNIKMFEAYHNFDLAFG